MDEPAYTILEQVEGIPQMLKLAPSAPNYNTVVVDAGCSLAWPEDNRTVDWPLDNRTLNWS